MTLRVMSFNIRHGMADDGPNSWPFRRESASKTIAAFAPDVLGLQEMQAFQNGELLERLPEYRMVGVGRDDGVADGEFCTVLYKGDEPSSSGTFWFSETPDVPGQGAWGAWHRRICTWVRFPSYALFNLHIDHESQLARENAIKLLLSRVGEEPVIVTGDFNAGEHNPAVQAMRDAGFRDTYRVLHPNGPASTYHGFQDEPEPDKIDYIWVSPHWEVESAEIVRERPDGRWPSDHFPVTAVLKLT